MADRWTAKVEKESEEHDVGDKKEIVAVPYIEFSAYEIYKDLLVEQRGSAP